MQAIIMAAGKGSRIEELTGTHPKSFLEIRGQKLIERNIGMLHHFGISDITIVTGYQDLEFAELLRDVAGVRLVYNPFYEMTNVIGSYFMGMWALREDFVYLHADTICEERVFRRLMEAAGDIVLPIDRKPCDEEAMKVRVVDGKVAQLTKEMQVTEAEGEFIGIAKFRKAVITDLNLATTQLMREKGFANYFEGALQRVLDLHKYDVQMLDITGQFWAEIDFPEDYERAKRKTKKSFL